jgi:hypothetical protein
LGSALAPCSASSARLSERLPLVNPKLKAPSLQQCAPSPCVLKREDRRVPALDGAPGRTDRSAAFLLQPAPTRSRKTAFASSQSVRLARHLHLDSRCGLSSPRRLWRSAMSRAFLSSLDLHAEGGTGGTPSCCRRGTRICACREIPDGKAKRTPRNGFRVCPKKNFRRKAGKSRRPLVCIRLRTSPWTKSAANVAPRYRRLAARRGADSCSAECRRQRSFRLARERWQADLAADTAVRECGACGERKELRRPYWHFSNGCYRKLLLSLFPRSQGGVYGPAQRPASATPISAVAPAQYPSRCEGRQAS